MKMRKYPKVVGKDSYNILLDSTLHFSHKQQLFVSVIKDGERTYLEISDRQCLLFRKTLNPKANLNSIHSFVSRKLGLLTDYTSCRGLVQFANSQKLLKEALFIIDVVLSGEITWNKILKLQEVHNFDVSFEFDNSQTEDRHKLKIVYIKFDGNEKHLGKFIPTKTAQEFQFIKNPE